jgi:hypothetical protein
LRNVLKMIQLPPFVFEFLEFNDVQGAATRESLLQTMNQRSEYFVKFITNKMEIFNEKPKTFYVIEVN